MMSQDELEQGKLFVGGLSWETTEDRLKNYFSQYGDVVECIVMKNPETGKSRGFGFVTYNDQNSVKAVLSTPSHQLDGRTVDPKECNPKNAAKSKKEAKQSNTPKVFLGGLPANITETTLKSFFGKYGKVAEVIIMYDQEKKKSRGFGFLSFENEDSINKVVAEHYVNINGKQVEVKRAEPQHMKSSTPAPNGNNSNAMIHGGHPGAGGATSAAGIPYFAMTPWGVWPAAPIPIPSHQMNQVTPPAYASTAAWNSQTAAAVVAASAAAAIPTNWPGAYGYPPQWAYGQPQGAFPQPNQGQNVGNNSQSSAAAHANQASHTQSYLAAAGNPNMNQQVANNSNIPSAMQGIGAYQQQHDQGGYVSQRNGGGGGAGSAAGFGANNGFNTHGSAAAYGGGGGANSFVNPIQPPSHHAEAALHQNASYNAGAPGIPFGSRVASQNQGYHPYRRA